MRMMEGVAHHLRYSMSSIKGLWGSRSGAYGIFLNLIEASLEGNASLGLICIGGAG